MMFINGNASSVNCTAMNETTVTNVSCNGTTGTTPPPYRCPRMMMSFEGKVGLTVAYCVVLLIALIGNSLITAVVLGNKSMKKSTNYFIVNMALSDLVVPLLVIPREITELWYGRRRWLLDGSAGMVLCKVAGFLQDVSTAVSVFSLILITFDRFFAVVFPLKHHILSSKMCKILILLTWLSAAGLHAIYLHVITLVKRPGHDEYYCLVQWSTYFHDPEGKIQGAYYISTFIGLCVIPFTIMAVAYTTILLQLRKQSAPLGDSMTDRQRRQRAERENKILRMAVAIVVSFACCWAPFNASAFLGMFVLPLQTPCWYYNFNFYAYFPAVVSAAVNPCICFMFSENYRQGLKVCLRKVCPGLKCLQADNRTVSSTTRVSKTQVTIYNKENRAFEAN